MIEKNKNGIVWDIAISILVLCWILINLVLVFCWIIKSTKVVFGAFNYFNDLISLI